MKRITLYILLLTTVSLVSSASVNEMRKLFITPPDSTRTKVWWFHGEDSVTKEGITADLEAFRRQGIGGIVYYDQVHGKGTNAPQLMSPEWWDAVLFSAKEAKRLGLSFEANVGNGYVAGGPWITPETGMKRVASSELLIDGGYELDTVLPTPQPDGGYFRDIATLAIPARNHGSITMLTDSVIRSHNPKDTIVIATDCGKEFTARSLTYTIGGRAKARTLAMNYPGKPDVEFYGCLYRKLPSPGVLEVSDDGVSYRKVADLDPRYRNHGGVKFKTISFPSTAGRFFRIRLHDWGSGHPDDDRMSIEDVTLHQDALTYAWEEKAALVSEYVDGNLTPAYSPEETISRDEIVDLSPYVDENGRLKHAALPKGKWIIMRFGAISTGAKTKHGRKGALGLECDKLSTTGAATQWQNYVQPLVDSIRANGYDIEGVTMDSHEAGPQNWTAGFEKDFSERNGYDIIPFLPAMTGYVIDNPETTAGFLHDLRRTLSQLSAERYYGAFDSLARKEGLRFTAQAIGGALCLTGDNIEIKKFIDKPQGEFWAYQTDGSYDIKDCSSSAHLYGKRIASGEAFTDAKYSHKPSDIKHLADYACAFGINEFVVCASAYQPSLEGVPGNTAYGRQYCLNRNNTFWEFTKPMWDSQARCNYMLRQGEPVVDLGVYLGDDVPIRIISHRLPEIPAGFNFDGFTTDALMTMTVNENGKIALPSGMKYSAIALPATALPHIVAEKIMDLKKQGAVIFNPNDGKTLPEFLKAGKVTPDIAFNSEDSIFFAHRKLDNMDIYFINNCTIRPISDTFTFNTSRTQAEKWDHTTGAISALPFKSNTEGMNSLDLTLAPHESIFVILHDGQDSPQYVNFSAADTFALNDGWSAWFDPEMGGPGTVDNYDLEDYTLSSDSRIKHFSGTAIFSNRFKATPEKATAYELKIDGFSDVAEVFVNDSYAGSIWCSPWTLDITPYIISGDNKIVLKVANSLYNRMIGDLALPENERFTFASTPIVDSDTPLVPSGISGPVTITRYIKD